MTKKKEIDTLIENLIEKDYEKIISLSKYKDKKIDKLLPYF